MLLEKRREEEKAIGGEAKTKRKGRAGKRRKRLPPQKKEVHVSQMCVRNLGFPNADQQPGVRACQTAGEKCNLKERS